MFRRILVPLDGSTFSEAALPAAVTLARASGGEVRLLTVVEVPPIFVYPEFRSGDREAAEDYVRTVAARILARSGGTPTTAVREGYIAREIRAEASAWDADLIVIATHGRGGLSRLWLGSVADATLRDAERPLLMVRPPEAGGADPEAPFTTERIVVPLDGSELAESALPAALALARGLGRPLVLLRALTYLGAPQTSLVPQTVELDLRLLEEEKEAAQAYLEGLAVRLRGEGVTLATRVVPHPRAERAILEEAGRDLIVMTTHGRSGLDRAVLGSVADKVIRGTEGAVLVARGGG